MQNSELFYRELMNKNYVLHEEDQLSISLRSQNEHLFPKAYEDNIKNNDMQSGHQFDNLQRGMPFFLDQSREMMTLKQQGHFDQNSLLLEDQYLLRRQRLLYAQQEQQRNTMLLQYQLNQQEKQRKLLQLDHRNNSCMEIMRSASSAQQDMAPMLNTTFLESNLSPNIPLHQSHAYRSNMLNSNEMLQSSGVNHMNQYQILLEQQQHFSNLSPSEDVPYSWSKQEMGAFDEINHVTTKQQQSINHDVVPMEFANELVLNDEKHYRNTNLHQFQLPDSANDRKMTSPAEPNVTDLYNNQASIQPLRTNNEIGEIIDDEFAALKRFLDRKNERAVAGYIPNYRKPFYDDNRGHS